MKTLLRRLIWEEQGQDLIEYALLAAFIALAAVVGMNLVSGGINTFFGNIGTKLGTLVVP